MIQAKILIAYFFLLAFAFQVSAQEQTPKVVWKNLKEKYDSFYAIKPGISNEGRRTIYYHPYPWVDLFYWDDKAKQWRDTYRFLCYVGTKFVPEKLKPQQNFFINLDNEEWDTMTVNDYMSPKFKSFPDYNGTGKYKLRLFYGLKKSELSFEVFSPEFVVVEKDFKK